MTPEWKDEWDREVQMVPINQINVANHRDRGRERFGQIVSSIRKLGIKKPITITPATGNYGDLPYDLICGEGRLLACQANGYTEIPARVVRASREELLVMSLVENLARRSHSSAELLREIGSLKERGYNHSQIAGKTGLDVTYVREILRLLNRGEERLIQAVERRQLPLKIAMVIATATDAEVQKALADAYERGDLRGKALLRARQIVEGRLSKGRSIRKGVRLDTDTKSLSADHLVKAYREETGRQQDVVRRARLCETQLLIIGTGMKRLLTDDNFITLLRAESLDTFPRSLSDQFN